MGTALEPKYLRALLERSRQGDPTWGHEGSAIPILERWLRYLKEGDDAMLPSDIEGMWASLDHRGVPSWEIAALKEVPVPKVRPKPVKPPPVFTQEALQALEEASGRPIYILKVRPNGPYQPHEDLHLLTEVVPDLDAFVADVKAWTKAFESVGKYPSVKRVFDKHCRKVILDPTLRGTASASWSDRHKALIVRLGQALSTSVPYIRSILIHEIGHMLAEEPDFPRTDLWLQKLPYGNPPYVSEYAEKSPDEDFAESYRAFWTEPGALRQRAPEKYRDMKSRVASRWIGRLASR